MDKGEKQPGIAVEKEVGNAINQLIMKVSRRRKEEAAIRNSTDGMYYRGVGKWVYGCFGI